MNTYSHVKTLPKTKISELSPRYAIFFISAALSVFLLLHPTISPISVSRGLDICVKRLIPALFPFLCVSAMLERAGFGKVCGRLIGAPFSALTGMPPECASAFVLGLVCGFPIGGKTALGLHQSGIIDEKECISLCVLCNNPGPGFVIAAVGSGIFGSTALGARLFALNILSAYTAFLISKPMLGIKKRTQKTNSMQPKIQNPDFSATSVLSSSIANAAVSMLKICGFVIFFGLLADSLCFLFPSDSFRRIICAVSEISLGCTEARGSLSATAFALGFGGLSSAFQLFSFSSSKTLPLTKFLLLKALQGLIFFGAICAF